MEEAKVLVEKVVAMSNPAIERDVRQLALEVPSAFGVGRPSSPLQRPSPQSSKELPSERCNCFI